MKVKRPLVRSYNHTILHKKSHQTKNKTRVSVLSAIVQNGIFVLYSRPS